MYRAVAPKLSALTTRYSVVPFVVIGFSMTSDVSSGGNSPVGSSSVNVTVAAGALWLSR